MTEQQKIKELVDPLRAKYLLCIFLPLKKGVLSLRGEGFSGLFGGLSFGRSFFQGERKCILYAVSELKEPLLIYADVAQFG